MVMEGTPTTTMGECGGGLFAGWLRGGGGGWFWYMVGHALDSDERKHGQLTERMWQRASWHYSLPTP